jgi:hypothetical protein
MVGRRAGIATDVVRLLDDEEWLERAASDSYDFTTPLPSTRLYTLDAPQYLSRLSLARQP